MLLILQIILTFVKVTDCLVGAMRVALGSAATGVFSNSTPLWQRLQKAGAVTGDRVWRFPLWDYYTKEITSN